MIKIRDIHDKARLEEIIEKNELGNSLWLSMRQSADKRVGRYLTALGELFEDWHIGYDDTKVVIYDDVRLDFLRQRLDDIGLYDFFTEKRKQEIIKSITIVQNEDEKQTLLKDLSKEMSKRIGFEYERLDNKDYKYEYFVNEYSHKRLYGMVVSDDNTLLQVGSEELIRIEKDLLEKAKILTKELQDFYGFQLKECNNKILARIDGDKGFENEYINEIELVSDWAETMAGTMTDIWDNTRIVMWNNEEMKTMFECLEVVEGEDYLSVFKAEILDEMLESHFLEVTIA